eukprot:6199368-Pleurochrysis_carterae.AAC.2
MLLSVMCQHHYKMCCDGKPLFIDARRTLGAPAEITASEVQHCRSTHPAQQLLPELKLIVATAKRPAYADCCRRAQVCRSAALMLAKQFYTMVLHFAGELGSANEFAERMGLFFVRE